MKNKIVLSYRFIILVYYLLAFLIVIININHLERVLIYSLILIVLFGIVVHVYILNIPKLLLSNKYIEKNLSTVKEAIDKIHNKSINDSLITIYIFLLEISNYKEEYQNFVEQNSKRIFDEKQNRHWYTIKLQYYYNLNKKDEVKYELIGYLISKNASVVKNNVRYATESEYNINRFSKLLRNLDIDNNIEFDGKSFIITFKVKNLIQEVKVVENQLEIKSNVDSEDIKKISRVQSEKLIQNDRNNKLIIMENDNCKRAIVRGAFLGAGSINNPSRTYHLEINLSTKNNMEFLDEILKQCNIRCKKLENNNSIYLKDGEEISAIIALFGASSSVLKFEDIRVQKEMNGKVNRIVNCQSANLNKTLNASVEQIDAIRRLQQSNKFNNLDDNLKEIALLRLEYPDMSLVELGKKLKEPLGKSGVNYRLKRIIKIAEDL